MTRQKGAAVMQRVVVAGLVMVSAATVTAQQSRVEGQSADTQVQQRRFQFQLIEGVLENAVRQGATEVAMRAHEQMGIPTGTLFMGPAQAKGFPLDGYGMVFHIEIPLIMEAQVLLSQLSAPLPPSNKPVGDRGTPPPPGMTRSTGVVPDDPMARSPIVTDSFLADPNAFYRTAVRDKLVDVMLDYSWSLNVPDGEWLSVVARSADGPGPASLQDDSPALILRVKGADLALFRTGKITRDEAKKRVIESQF
jgi:hypothetical protein